MTLFASLIMDSFRYLNIGVTAALMFSAVESYVKDGLVEIFKGLYFTVPLSSL